MWIFERECEIKTWLPFLNFCGIFKRRIGKFINWRVWQINIEWSVFIFMCFTGSNRACKYIIWIFISVFQKVRLLLYERPHLINILAEEKEVNNRKKWAFKTRVNNINRPKAENFQNIYEDQDSFLLLHFHDRSDSILACWKKS